LTSVVLTIILLTPHVEAAMAGRVPVNDAIVQAARELLKKPSGYRDRLRQIISGKVKSIDADWWRSQHGVAHRQRDAYTEKAFKAKLDKIAAMADPARNPSAHQRQVAEAALAKLQTAGPPKTMRMPSAPGLEDYDREQERRRPPPLPSSIDELLRTRAERQGARKRNTTTRPVNTTKSIKARAASVNTTKTKSRTGSVNTTTSKPRSADRHREPNRDRHSPGYMRDYMRRRRAKPSQ
jgi:hypothetical protein